ncbi:MAG: hypothetical protein HQ549_06755 [Candidatus Omnitrophica bacterium]|nr:hypothetical protein [Candidatus Omnitrophota bacterium]
MSRRFKILFEVLFGTLLIGLSFFCFGLASYLIFKNEIVAGAAEKTQIKKIEEVHPRLSPEPRALPSPEPRALPRKTRDKTGILWIDKKSSRYMLNLGSSDGIHIGDNLDIYDRDGNKAGRVKIVTLLDLVSYAEPTKADQKLTGNYYDAVLIEASQ